MKAGQENSSSCENRGRREPAHHCAWHHARTRRCGPKARQQPKLIPHSLLLLTRNCLKHRQEPEPRSALPGGFGQQVAFCLLTGEAPSEEGFGTGLQRTGPAGSCCDHAYHAEDPHKLSTTDNSDGEESAPQSCTALQAAGVHLGWALNVGSGEEAGRLSPSLASAQHGGCLLGEGSFSTSQAGAGGGEQSQPLREGSQPSGKAAQHQAAEEARTPR